MQLMLWVRVLGIYTQYYFQNESHESQSKQQDNNCDTCKKILFLSMILFICILSIPVVLHPLCFMRLS
jgi:hypothetical protein